MQDAEGMRAVRQRCIDRMHESLDNVEMVELPGWLLILILVPVSLMQILGITLRTIIMVLVGMVKQVFTLFATPFYGLFVWFDTVLIFTWFFWKAAYKMNGGKN